MSPLISQNGATEVNCSGVISPSTPEAVGHLLKASFATTLANRDWALMRMTGLPWSSHLQL